MPDTSPAIASTPDIPGGPYDIEFFFDPGCPFAWMTSRWIHRVVELKGITVGWRFISLKVINEDHDQPPQMRDAQVVGNRYHRICASVRQSHGNDMVGRLYTAFGEAFWNQEPRSDFMESLSAAAGAVDFASILADLGLPADVLAAADEESFDQVLRDETALGFSRTGDDVGTPIITYGPPHGNSLFGPVISSVPDDETSVAFYDALRTMVDFDGFSELKRTKRAPLALRLLEG